jgi:hypothetical protein
LPPIRSAPVTVGGGFEALSTPLPQRWLAPRKLLFFKDKLLNRDFRTFFFTPQDIVLASLSLLN